MSARRRRPHLPLAAILIVLAAGLLGACGDNSNESKLLSASAAAELRSTLAGVEQRVESGDCDGAQEQVSLLDQQVTSLDGVEADLQEALASGVVRLQQLVSEECQAPAVDTGAADTTGTTGPSDTGGTTGPEKTDEDGKGKKEKNKKKDKLGGEDGGTGQDGGDDSGGSGGTTGSGGFGE